MTSFRTPIFDWVRHGLALAVIISHSFALLHGAIANEPVLWLTGGQFSTGTLAVFGFFALSGYLITASWQRTPRALAFASRRLARILPAWGLAMVGGAYIVLPLATGHWPQEAHALLGFIPAESVFPHNPLPNILNASLWSIPNELFCYGLVMLFGMMRMLNQRSILAWLFTAELVAVSAYVEYGMVVGPILFIASFWAGALARYAPPAFRSRWIHVGVLLSLPFAILSREVVFVLPLYAGWLLTWLPSCPAPEIPVDWSYGLYVYTFPIQQGLVALFGTQLTPVSLALLSITLSIPISALSWRIVEEPALQWATTLWRRTRQPVRQQLHESESSGGYSYSEEQKR